MLLNYQYHRFDTTNVLQIMTVAKHRPGTNSKNRDNCVTVPESKAKPSLPINSTVLVDEHESAKNFFGSLYFENLTVPELSTLHKIFNQSAQNFFDSLENVRVSELNTSLYNQFSLGNDTLVPVDEQRIGARDLDNGSLFRYGTVVEGSTRINSLLNGTVPELSTLVGNTYCCLLADSSPVEEDSSILSNGSSVLIILFFIFAAIFCIALLFSYIFKSR